MSVINWIKTADKKPTLRRTDKTTNCAMSAWVLGAFKDEDGHWYYETTYYRRGGKGDDTTCYWWTDKEPICWASQSGLEPKFN